MHAFVACIFCCLPKESPSSGTAGTPGEAETAPAAAAAPGEDEANIDRFGVRRHLSLRVYASLCVCPSLPLSASLCGFISVSPLE